MKDMQPDKHKLKLAHLYFIPKAHKPNISVRPIIASINAPARCISSFLDKLLSPIFDQVARKTTLINGIDLVRALEKYRDNCRLLPTTQFITSDVTDLYTMIPRDGALAALGHFCIRHSADRKIGNLLVDTILQLARTVLDTNSFAYNYKYYKQTKGGAMGLPFTMVLANIYMLEWKQPLIQHQAEQNELYGR
ncbi:unnamed protein product, partial [Didymodactylos carnosus]